jgi:hypothetical protein
LAEQKVFHQKQANPRNYMGPLSFLGLKTLKESETAKTLSTTRLFTARMDVGQIRAPLDAGVRANLASSTAVSPSPSYET